MWNYMPLQAAYAVFHPRKKIQINQRNTHQTLLQEIKCQQHYPTCVHLLVSHHVSLLH